MERQVDYLAKLLEEMIRRETSSVEVRACPQEEFTAAVRGKLKGLTWMSPGCQSWRTNEFGEVVTLWPDTVMAYDAATKEPDFDAFHFQ